MSQHTMLYKPENVISRCCSTFSGLQGGPKNGYPVLFWDNFGNSAPIVTILLLLQAEIYGA